MADNSLRWIDVAGVDEIAPGDVMGVDVDNLAIAVANVDGSFHAIGDICSHAHAYLSEGPLEGCQLECPLHQARFDVRTGEALTPPAVEPVPAYKTKVENGRVLIGLEG